MAHEGPAALRACSLAFLLFFVTRAPAAERIVIDGSTGVMPLATALAKAFQERHPSIAIELGKGLGTKARLQALSDGRIDVALASHGLDIAEVTRQGMAVHEVARIAIVFGVNATVSVANVTDEQICAVYSGSTTNWKALGGPEMVLEARTRPDSEVDAEVVRATIACLKDLRMPKAVKVMPRAGDMAKELAGVPGAVGMTTMTVIEQSHGNIKPLSLNGVAPSAQNVERRTYPLVRTSYFVMKSPAAPEIAQFIEFVRSAAGSQVIQANGAIPVK
jgi:phosphate transport system substrate-binding protein